MQALHVENCRGITPIKYTHRLVVDHTVSSYNLVRADGWVIHKGEVGQQTGGAFYIFTGPQGVCSYTFTQCMQSRDQQEKRTSIGEMRKRVKIQNVM